jgi:hypothetical protein
MRIEPLEERRLLSFPIGVGGTGSDVGNSVAADQEGNVYVAGLYEGTVDFDPGAGTANLSGGGGFVAKYLADGTFVWARRFDGATPAKVATDKHNNVYVAGSFSGTVDFDPRSSQHDVTSGGGSDAFVVRLTKNGNFGYAATFGGQADDTAGGLAVSTLGQVFVGGTFAGRADFDPSTSGVTSIGNSGGDDGFIASLDETGAFRWAGSFEGPNDEEVSDLALDDSGNVLATGSYLGTTDFDPTNGTALTATAGNPEGFTLKWDNNGAFVWVAGFGGTGTTYATSVTVDRSGNVYTIGNFSRTVDLDPSGATFPVAGPKSGRVFVSKLDSSGAMVWGKAIGGSTVNDFGPGEVSVDRHDDVFVTGRFAGTQDFDPDGGTQNLTSNGDDDVFVSKLDSNGAFVFAKSLGGPTRDLARGSTLDRDGNILTTGAFTGTADFDPSGGTSNLVSNGSDDDIFVSKLDASGVLA